MIIALMLAIIGMGLLYVVKNSKSALIIIEYISFVIFFVIVIGLVSFQNSEVSTLMRICYDFNVPAHTIAVRTELKESKINEIYKDFKVQDYRSALNAKEEYKKVQAKK